MVKPLHPIDEIAARIVDADGQGVRLTHGANGRSATVDPIAAVIRALGEPMDYPPLAAGIVPGDRVAVAVDEAVPDVGRVVLGAVKALEQAGVERPDISIVTTDAQTSQLCRDALTCEGASCGAKPQFVVHDPCDDNNLCLVGTMKRGEPLLVNKAIFDADLVLPIGCARIDRASAYESVFPRFTNAAVLNEYRSPGQRTAIASRNRKRKEADEAGWMIGVTMALEVVPGPGNTVRQVLAGQPPTVVRASDELVREEWLLESPQRVGLVVATITGGPAAQTWANVGRALAAVEDVLEADGALVICSNLQEPIGPSLGRLVRSPDIDSAIRKIAHDRDADSWTAWRLANALERGPVYLLSQLDSEAVEDLGVAPVESVEEIARLAGRHGSFVVLNDAQHAMVRVRNEGHEANDE